MKTSEVQMRGHLSILSPLALRSKEDPGLLHVQFPRASVLSYFAFIYYIRHNSSAANIFSERN